MRLFFRTFSLAHVGILFGVSALFGTGSVGRAQTFVPTPLAENEVVPKNRTVDSAGNGYGGLNVLAKFTSGGIVTPLATLPSHIQPPSSAPVYDFEFTDVALDAADNVYAAALSTAGSPRELIVKVTPTGSVSMTQIAIGFFVNRTANRPKLTVDTAGNVFTIGPDGSIVMLKTDGTQAFVAPDQPWFYSNVGDFPNPPQGLSVDPQGNLYTTVTNLNLTNLTPTHYAGALKLLRLTSYPQVAWQPQGATIPFGNSYVLTVAAASTGHMAYQWYQADGSAVAGAGGPMAPGPCNLSVATYTTNAPGSYFVVISGDSGLIASNAAVVSTVTSSGAPVTNLPLITGQPQAGSLTYGGVAGLAVTALSTMPLTYQWRKDGGNLLGATAPSYDATSPGNYTVVVSTSAGSVTSDSASIGLVSRPVNLSSRALVGTDSNVSIAGFVIASYDDAFKRVLVRGIGPGLAQLGVTGFLARPVLTIFDSSGRVVASNTGWSDATEISTASKTVGAFTLPVGSADSALLLDLAPGAYTAQVSGVNSTTGIALVEAYELAADYGHFVNISTRAAVSASANILIGGLVIAGTQTTPVLIRAVGPGLIGLGVSGALKQPVLSIYDSKGRLIALNVGWSNGSSADAVAIAGAATKTGAFPLLPGSADSAILLNLAPGAYTAQVSGANDTTGVALVEVYHVPQ